MLSDTTPEVEEIYLKKLKEKTDSERALMGFSMFETARYIVNSSLAENLSIIERRAAVFERFYGSDFNENDKQKIVRYLRGV